MSVSTVLGSIFEKLGLDSKSCIMLHGDLAILAQFNLLTKPNKNEFVDSVLDYFSPMGTVVVPTFTYSATSGEKFSHKHTKSKIGSFSESFRNSSRMQRTYHPNFSCMVYGREKESFMNATIKDAFGKETIFDRLFQNDGEIVAFGSSINSTITFTHYVEQMVGVPYRYMKKFVAQMDDEFSVDHVHTNYYVRKMDENLNTEIDLKRFRARALLSDILRTVPFGRLECFAISSHDCYYLMRKMLLEDPYSLIKGH